MVRRATGRTTASGPVVVVIAWEIEVVAVVAEEAIMADEGAPREAEGADRHHLATGKTTVAGAGADRVKDALASYVKAVASCAMRRATLSGTARTTAVADDQCIVAPTATRIVTDTTTAGGHRSREAVLHLSIGDTTTEEVATLAVAGAWAAPHPGDTTTADRHHLKRTGPVAIAASATEEELFTVI